MITILPVKDPLKADHIKNANHLSSFCTILGMEDGESFLGFAAVEHKENALHIIKLQANGYDFLASPNPEQHFILDSLVRSAASYGENFGVESIVTAFPDFFGFMQSKGFAIDAEKTTAPIHTIVTYKQKG